MYSGIEEKPGELRWHGTGVESGCLEIVCKRWRLFQRFGSAKDCVRNWAAYTVYRSDKAPSSFREYVLCDRAIWMRSQRVDELLMEMQQIIDGLLAEPTEEEMNSVREQDLQGREELLQSKIFCLRILKTPYVAKKTL